MRHNTLKLFLIFLFFGAQMVSLLHMAERGFAEHEHDGQTCELYLYSGQSDGVALAASPLLHTPDYVTYVPVSPELSVIASHVTGDSQARAPPIFS